jgi:hypothetical protein
MMPIIMNEVINEAVEGAGAKKNVSKVEYNLN